MFSRAIVVEQGQVWQAESPATIEINQDDDSEEDEDHNLVDFYRSQNLLQESDQAHKPCQFPNNFE